MKVVLPPPPGAPGPVRLLKRARSFFQPDIWVVDVTGDARVWKTWTRKSFVERWVGRWLSRREGRIIAALQDIEGFPRFLGHPDPTTVEMSLLDAEPVPEVKQGTTLDEQYFARLWEMIAAMHSRGINHGDLRRKNLLRRPNDPSTPRMVDFTQSFHFSPPVDGLRGKIFRQAIRVDRVTYFKLKRWYLGKEALTAAEQEELDSPPWHLKVGRALRSGIYRPLKHLLRG